MRYSKEQQIGKRFKPKQKERNRIKAKDYNKAVEVWGNTCFCGSTQNLQMHHLKFRSSGIGRGGFTNSILLCEFHHRKAHSDYDFRKNLEIQRRRVCGEHFYKDEFDLWEEGLIEEPTRTHWDDFMRREISAKGR